MPAKFVFNFQVAYNFTNFMDSLKYLRVELNLELLNLSHFLFFPYLYSDKY